MRLLAVFSMTVLLSGGANSALATTTPRVVPVAVRHQLQHPDSTESGDNFTKALIAPGVALFVGLINLFWNFANSRATRKIGAQASQSARKMAALTPYRRDAVELLKNLQAHTNELVSIPRSANYNGTFKPGQGRFIASSRQLRDLMTMMSLDPEVDGNNWRDCFDKHYDSYMDCSNTLLNPQTSDADHASARQRLTEMARSMQADVLARFSSAINSAQD